MKTLAEKILNNVGNTVEYTSVGTIADELQKQYWINMEIDMDEDIATGLRTDIEGNELLVIVTSEYDLIIHDTVVRVQVIVNGEYIGHVDVDDYE